MVPIVSRSCAFEPILAFRRRFREAQAHREESKGLPSLIKNVLSGGAFKPAERGADLKDSAR